MKTAIFVIGEYGSGKTSIIRALTGCSDQRYLRRVRTLSNRLITAFVISSALQERETTATIDPTPSNEQSFLAELERVYHMSPDSYELLICPLEIDPMKRRRGNRRYTPVEYLQAFVSLGFDVRIVVIGTAWDGTQPQQQTLQQVQQFATNKNLPIEILDIHNSDEHLEARKVRDKLYPQ